MLSLPSLTLSFILRSSLCLGPPGSDEPPPTSDAPAEAPAPEPTSAESERATGSPDPIDEAESPAPDDLDDEAASEDDAPGQAESGAAAGDESTPGEPRSRYRELVEDSPFNRKGWVLQVGPGFNDCLSATCSENGWNGAPLMRDAGSYTDADFRLGPTLKIDFGYRPIEYLALTSGLSVSFVPVRGRPNHDLFGIWYSTMFNVVAYPLAFSRFDPYVGLGLGFYQLWSHEENRIDTTIRLNRANFRVMTGIDVLVTERFAVGPRFDYNVGFSGEMCVRTDFPGGGSPRDCSDVRDLERSFQNRLPQPFEFAVMFGWRL